MCVSFTDEQFARWNPRGLPKNERLDDLCSVPLAFTAVRFVSFFFVLDGGESFRTRSGCFPREFPKNRRRASGEWKISQSGFYSDGYI